MTNSDYQLCKDIALTNCVYSRMYSSPNVIKTTKGSEMGGACSAHGGDEKCVKHWWECQKGRDESGGIGADGRLLLNGFYLNMVGACELD